MNNNPLVSVYIPTKNRPDFLRAALASLVNQEYKNIEVLVCDDGSDVDLSDIRREFEKKLNLVWIRNEKSMGACSARNILLNASRGEYVTGLDDDDEFLPNRINEFLAAKELSVYGFLSSGYVLAFEGGRQIPGANYSGIIDLAKMKQRNFVGNQVFVARDRMLEIGGFDTNFPSWQDYDTWFRLILKHGPGYAIGKRTYKLNVGHEIGRVTSSVRARQGYKMFVEKHASHLAENDIELLRVRDIVNRGDSIRVGDFIRNPSLKKTGVLAKYLIKKLAFRVINKVR